jgi:putative phosphoesterase
VSQSRAPAGRESGSPVVVGLIADTHGLVRPDVFMAFDGVSAIFHAGDVGGREVLHILGQIAPVQAVFGNTDMADDPELCRQFTETVGGLSVHVSHGHEAGSPTPAWLLARYDADVLVYGHTHRPLVARVGGRLVVNPGSAGPRRFDLVPTVARLTIRGGVAEAEIIELSA